VLLCNRVNELNVDMLMSCALPYHGTVQFVRLVQTMRLDGIWAFLAPMQQSGAPLPRSSLVQRCCADAALMEFICKAAQQASSPAWLSFYGVVVSEVIPALPQVGGRPV
jgi:U3 small nucleolar RNA-associated protein 10